MKRESIPKVGRVGDTVYYIGRTGKLARAHTDPKNPRTEQQMAHRDNVGVVSARWHTLTPQQRAAWCLATATTCFLTETGQRARLNGYNFFVSLNTRRADLGLSQFDLPPARPVFPPNPVDELVLINTADTFSLKLRVTAPPAQYTLVCGPAPLKSGIRYVDHFPFLGLLPPPEDGWCDITELYVARHRVPKVDEAVWIRICQHIDGWTDSPKVFRARLLAPTPGTFASPW
jgi:uncharacterized protein YbdZ (MbtH family)